MLITTLLIVLTGAPANDAEARLMSLLDATHGAGATTSPATAVAARGVCENFERFSPLLDRWLDPQFFSASEDPLAQMRVANASSLAVGCGKDGIDLLVPRLNQARAMRDTKTVELLAAASGKNGDVRSLQRQVEALLAFERQGIMQLRAVRSDRLVEALIPRVATDTQLSLEIVEYFSSVAPGDDEVRTALNSLLGVTPWKDLRLKIEDYLRR